MAQIEKTNADAPATSTADGPGPRTSAVLAGLHRDGGFVFGVVAKRTYLVAGGKCHEAPEQVPLVEEPRLAADEGMLEHDTDLVLQREQADIVVQGHAYSPGSGSFTSRIKVGGFTRELAVFGDRRLERTSRGLRFTSPAPCDRIPLSWESAYGGVDHVALREHGDPMAELVKEAGLLADPRFGLYGYPRNPMGKGYLLEPTAEAIDACRLPNLEEPRQLLRPDTIVRGHFMRWPTGPLVAATGWLSHNFFPRTVQLSLPPAPYNDEEVGPRDFIEVRAGLVRPESVLHQTPVQERLDHRAVQSSAVGMRAEDIPPKAKVELIHLHPRESRWRFRLPCQSPRMAYRLHGEPPAELEPRIRTVLLEPDRDRVTLVWVGEQRLNFPLTPEQLSDLRHGVVWG